MVRIRWRTGLLQRQGPDFLCIGMQKAGTGWMYRAFNEIDGFQMLPIKEFHHFDRIGQTERLAGQREKQLRRQLAQRNGLLSRESRARLSTAVDAYIESGYSTKFYLKLFEENRDWLTGDITPSYSTLKKKAVRRVYKVLPDRPVILSVRHPVDRVWSAFNMYLRRQFSEGPYKITSDSQPLLENEATIEKLEAYLATWRIMERSKPSEAYEAWSVYGDNLIVVSLDEIIKSPKLMMERVASRILRRQTILPDEFEVRNNKNSAAKVKMSAQHRNFLFDVFGDEIQACKRRFPEIAEDWQTS